jgi:NAD(P)-dependent dehydrogenase (short-subunit alcohol dehydrogenase family)
LGRLEGKVAVITGAGSGIGLATSVLFAREGAKVVVADISDNLGMKTVSEIKRTNGEAVFVHADVAKESEVEGVVSQALSKYGRLDIMFNNAGIIVVKKVVDSSEAEWDKLVSVNLKGVFLGSKCAAKHMIGQKRGSIVNTASIYGLVGASHYAPYCATKSGVIGFTRALALELAPYNVRVNCICPGVITTAMFDGELAIWKKLQPEDDVEKLFKSQHPLGRFGEPIDIANAALYLASDESTFVTGSSIVVDGGYTAV